MIEAITGLSFGAPWVLSALLLLPLLWHFMKSNPPRPQTIDFPAVRLLQELKTDKVLATKTPWWVLVIRSLIAASLIAALAQPMFHASTGQSKHNGPLVIIVDNGWSVMDRWSIRRSEIEKIIDQAERDNRQVALIETALPHKTDFNDAHKVRAQFHKVSPQPWEVRRQDTLAVMNKLLEGNSNNAELIWISNDLSDASATDFGGRLSELGMLVHLSDGPDLIPTVISQTKRTSDGFSLTLLHPATSEDRPSHTTFLSETGEVLVRQPFVISAHTDTSALTINLPSDLKSQAHLIRIGNFVSPASQYLLDEKWRDRPVGIITAGAEDQKLLDPAHYVRKSLAPHAPLRSGTLERLLQEKVAVLVDDGSLKLNASQIQTLQQWVEKGGVLIRFAALKKQDDGLYESDTLLPVPLRPEERTFGGALSWKKPGNLAAFPDTGPLQGLSIAKDIRIHKQLLARPDAFIENKIWAEMEDGTPLISGTSMGKGWLSLFHITATPQWSNLPMSGTFENIMIRLLNLSQGVVAARHEVSLQPLSIFNSQGDLVSPSAPVRAFVDGIPDDYIPDQYHPPGLYGSQNKSVAVNLGPNLTSISALSDLPPNTTVRGFTPAQSQDGAPYAFALALLLALLDWSLTIWRRTSPMALASLLITLMIPLAAQAETDWSRALAAANTPRLAFIQTGDPKIDEVSKRGLDGLTTVLHRRTAVEMGPAQGLDLDKDDPALFPMIYWPITGKDIDLSDEAAQKLNRFMRVGGFILFDTQGQRSPASFSKLTQKLDIAPLQPVPTDHVLTRSFYLLNQFPGRYIQGKIWVEAHEDRSRDRVSSVLVGANSWAHAWARDDNLRPIYPVVPGGELHREQAYRFGVNLVMYILSGNYKGDQVHMPAIIQRLGL